MAAEPLDKGQTKTQDISLFFLIVEASCGVTRVLLARLLDAQWIKEKKSTGAESVWLGVPAGVPKARHLGPSRVACTK